MRRFTYNAPEHPDFVAYPRQASVIDHPPEPYPASSDCSDPEFPPSLAARFPSALRQRALSRETAVLAYHFWEARGCQRSSSEEEQDHAELNV